MTCIARRWLCARCRRARTAMEPSKAGSVDNPCSSHVEKLDGEADLDPAMQTVLADDGALPPPEADPGESRRQDVAAGWLDVINSTAGGPGEGVRAACEARKAVSAPALVDAIVPEAIPEGVPEPEPASPSAACELATSAGGASAVMELLVHHVVLSVSTERQAEHQDDHGGGADEGDSVHMWRQHFTVTTSEWLLHRASEEELLALLPPLLRVLTVLLPPLLASATIAPLHEALVRRAAESERVGQRLFWALAALGKPTMPHRQPVGGVAGLTPTSTSEGATPAQDVAAIRTLRQQVFSSMGPVVQEQLSFVRYVAQLADSPRQGDWERPTCKPVLLGAELRSPFDPRVRLPVSHTWPLCRQAKTRKQRLSLTFGRWSRDGVIDIKARPPLHDYQLLAFAVTCETSSRAKRFIQAQLVAELLGVLELTWRAEDCKAFLAGGGPSSKLNIQAPVYACATSVCTDDEVDAPEGSKWRSTAWHDASAALQLEELVPGQRTIEELQQPSFQRLHTDILGDFLSDQATYEAKRRRQGLLTCVQRLMWARILLRSDPSHDGSGVDAGHLVLSNLDLIQQVGECPLLSAGHCRWELHSTPAVEQWVWSADLPVVEQPHPEPQQTQLERQPEPELNPELAPQLESQSQHRSVAAATFYTYSLGAHAESQVVFESHENFLNSIAGVRAAAPPLHGCFPKALNVYLASVGRGQVCVACYVLGLGGLHHGNVVLSPTGGVFCTDCTQAFGNHRFKREFSEFAGLFGRPDDPLLRALGGFRAPAFAQMADRAVRAFVACRRHARLLLATLALTRLSPSLDSDDGLADAQYVRAHLHLEMTEEDAAEYFRAKLVATAEAGTKRQNSLAAAIHIVPYAWQR